MRCPNDGATELVADTLDRVAVHDCPSCAGVWLVRPGVTEEFAAAHAATPAPDKKCPQCGEAMRTLDYPDADVRIQVCVADHGVWLDKGEFDKIIGVLNEMTNAMSIAELEHATAEQFKEIFRPHASRSSEIKDFFTTFRLLETRFGTEHPTIAAAINAASRIGL